MGRRQYFEGWRTAKTNAIDCILALQLDVPFSLCIARRKTRRSNCAVAPVESLAKSFEPAKTAIQVLNIVILQTNCIEIFSLRCRSIGCSGVLCACTGIPGLYERVPDKKSYAYVIGRRCLSQQPPRHCEVAGATQLLASQNPLIKKFVTWCISNCRSLQQ